MSSNLAPADLARKEVQTLHQAWSLVFSRLPVSSSQVARALGIKVKPAQEIQEPARLVYSIPTDGTSCSILTRPNMSTEFRRLAIAHEIGHAILVRRHPDLVRAWGVRDRERFAKSFARELVVPGYARQEFVEEFRKLGSPQDLLRLAARFGVWPQAILSLANRETTCLAGLNNFWLRIKHRTNKFTGLQPRLRIESAHYDRARFYIPQNQSVQSFCGNDEWLTNFEAGRTAYLDAGSVSLFDKRPNDSPKYRKTSLPARLAATRLRASHHDQSPHFVLLAQLHDQPQREVKQTRKLNIVSAANARSESHNSPSGVGKGLFSSQ